MMKKLTIMRGLPGSGKTTLLTMSPFDGAVICSADRFFEDDDGGYTFNPALIAQAHETCKILATQNMANHEPHVVIDNTNVCRWEFAIYQVLAEVFGYDVEIVVVGKITPEACVEYSIRNVHNVPLDVIQDMAERWEV
jgi:predicted kinase